ncbi:hypothetical protein V500_06431, partial [Pseudogymnoascus sp. VKM F-4518 (FW-2643)]
MRPPPPPLPAPHLLGLLALLLPAATATFTLSHPIPFGSHSTSQSQPPCGASPLLLKETTGFYCAPVAFRATRSGSVITLCSNGTDVTGLFASDPRLPSDGLPMEVSTAINLSAPTET